VATRRARLVRSVRSAATSAGSLVLVAAVLVAAVPASGEAAPPLTLPQVQARLAALDNQAEVAQEQLNQTQIDVVTAGRNLGHARDRQARSQAALAAAQVAVGRLAAALYRGGGMDQSLQLFLSADPGQYLQQAAELASVSGRQAEILRTAAVAKLGLDQAELVVKQQLDSVRRLHATAAADYARVQAAQASTTALLNSLQAAQRAALKRAVDQARARAIAQAAAVLAHAEAVARAEAAAAAQAAAAKAAAARAAAAAAAAKHRRTGTGTKRKPVVHHKPVRRPTPPPSTVPSGSIGARVVAYALARVGDAYVWGGAGPSSYDCSGLTMRAYQQVGIHLPHSAAGQARLGRSIPASQLQPGDLVFYYSPIHHVGIYIGGGMIVNAENPSVGVTITGLFSMPFAGAVRPY
jgi:cell wall-associated NlpC family hydrolase